MQTVEMNEIARIRTDFGEKFGRQFRYRQTQKVLDLGEEDHNGDAVGEPDHDRARDETDQAAHSCRCHANQNQAGEHCCEQ